VCRLSGTIVGTVGLEVMGDLGLLRSLAVLPELRGQRLGHALWDGARDLARRRGISRLYLLTTTAAGLFSRCGFKAVARDEVPEAGHARRPKRGVLPSSSSTHRRTRSRI
jgi:N-acetylglutamate synthase-like GNAT family acetyltransferase